ncbi:MAG: M28 family peptidase [Candidatus Xenobia bacterium]
MVTLAVLIVGSLWAWSRRPRTVVAAGEFDGQRAYKDLVAQCDMGVRAPGTPGHEQCAKWIEDQLTAMHVEHTRQAFVAGPDGHQLPMENIVARIPGKDDGTIVVGAHWDTKTFSNIKFVGANDGASGVALLLELGRVLQPSLHSVDLVFLDGEEAIDNEWMGVGLYGSHEFVQEAEKTGADKKMRAFILVDMIGDKSLRLNPDQRSTPWLRKLVWDQASKLGYTDHFNGQPLDVIDDHVPFLQDDIASVDLIDFDYGSRPGLNDYWHTAQDTADKCSADSLQIVGRVVQASLAKLQK